MPMPAAGPWQCGLLYRYMAQYGFQIAFVHAARNALPNAEGLVAVTKPPTLAPRSGIWWREA